MKKPPTEVQLSREEGEALIQRLEGDRLTGEDRRVLVTLVQWYFWLGFALRETKIGLKRLKAALFGEGRRRGPPGPGGGTTPPGAGGGPAGGSDPPEPPGQARVAVQDPTAGSAPTEETPSRPRQGHGRWAARRYPGATTVVCRHEQLEAGQTCPACGRGRLYPLPPGVELRLDGNALISAIRYEVQRLRCSGCGEVFRAPLPPGAGEAKYTARARAVLALGRYYLGLPFYRLEGFQALVGVPLADATQWDQVERVADCAWPVFEALQHLAAQGEVIYQDDTQVRILALMGENRQAEAGGLEPSRRGMYTTGLVIEQGERIICLYRSGRAHAGENLAALLARREAHRGLPIVMSDALAANHLADETALIRSHCLAHGQRQFVALEELFPQPCARVLRDLGVVFAHEARTREQAMSPAQRLAYHQAHSGPILANLKTWLEQQLSDREVEPNSSLGKALRYLLTHWQRLTRFLHVLGAPLENNTVERALKLMIRQRKNSLFYASAHSAYVADVLSSLIATCLQAGVNALEYLVALQTHRHEVFQNPPAWLPWNYPAHPTPS
ncbi:MAG: IS66 family transposase [Pseudomonadota bacterium]|nr:IS66 family transposase [Pseudomonadota bacterium]